MHTIKCLVLISALALLAGCGGYILMSGVSPSDGDGGGGDGSVVFDAPVVTIDPNSRATIIMEQPDDGADSWDVSIDDDDFDDVTGDSDCDDDDCEYNIPGLDPNEIYNVSVRYWKDGDLSLTTSVLLNTAFKETVIYGDIAEMNFGWSLAVGDLDGDGLADIAAGNRPSAAFDRSVKIYRGSEIASPVVWATYQSSETTSSFGNDLEIADITCDNRADLIIAQQGNAVGEGKVHMYDGTGITAGTHNANDDRLYKPRDDQLNTDFGNAMAVFDDGTGCHDIDIGAVLGHGGAGEVFEIAHTALVSPEQDIDNTFRLTGGPGPLAGLVVENVGDADGDGVEEVAFDVIQAVLGLSRNTTVRFNDDPGTDWAIISTQPNADHEFTMGHLVGGDFFISEGVDVGGGFVNIYTGNASNIPANILTSDTRNTFGVDAIVGDVYQAQSGLELLVGTDTHILVYFGYTEGSGLSDVTPDAILNIPGRSIHLVDINADGYLDIVSNERDADNGAISNVGSVNINR